jgi:hypothetical protein
MKFPTPDDPADAPVWENYVIVQAAQASLGVIPIGALAVGVQVRGTDVLLRLQMLRLAEQDVQDVHDIADALSDLLGPDVRVRETCEIRAEPALSPHDGVRWFFRARVDT